MRVPPFILVFSMVIFATTGVSKSGEEVKDLWNKISYSIRKAGWVSAFSAADPGFPRGGGASQGRGQNTKFPPKLLEIERIWMSLVSPP